MPYNLRFSDPSKTSTITVPDMPPGINTVDTSLSLVGRAYPSYGEKIAENFLRLLENFASPVPPENPIEGQLWYDTSDPRRKVLRVMDGTASATRWPLASGIYQQAADPKSTSSAGLKNGDIWVDTTRNQLKIFNTNDWTVVGPVVGSGTNKTGSEPAILIDSAPPNGLRHVILNWSEGYVVSIVSSGPEFTPNTSLPGMEGFTRIKPGINLSSRAVTGNTTVAQFNGKASDSFRLGGFESSNYLLKNDTSISGQQITGNVVYVIPIGGNPGGQDGVVVRIANQPTDEYVQFYKLVNDAVIFNNKEGGKILLKVKGSSNPTLSVSKNSVEINTSTVILGSLSVSNTVTSSRLLVTGNSQIDQSLKVQNNLEVLGTTTATQTIHVGSSSGSGVAILPKNTSTYDIGTVSRPFRNIYATSVYSSNYEFLPGTLKLHAGSTSTNPVPEGWLVCTGASVSTSTYANLFSVIRYYYGGSGNSFNIPNMFISTIQGAITTTTYYIIKT